MKIRALKRPAACPRCRGHGHDPCPDPVL